MMMKPFCSFFKILLTVILRMSNVSDTIERSCDDWLDMRQWMRILPCKVPPQHIQQRPNLPRYLAKSVESNLRYLRDLDLDPVAVVRPQPCFAGEFRGESIYYRVLMVAFKGVCILGQPIENQPSRLYHRVADGI